MLPCSAIACLNVVVSGGGNCSNKATWNIVPLWSMYIKGYLCVSVCPSALYEQAKHDGSCLNVCVGWGRGDYSPLE